MAGSPSRTLRWRWALLTIFVVGYGLTFSRLENAGWSYFVCTLLSLISCAVLLRVLDRISRATCAAWLALLLFLSVYFAKFYWIVLDADPLNTLLPEKALQPFQVPSVLASAYTIVSIAFCVFCWASIICWRWCSATPNTRSAAERLAGRDIYLYELGSRIALCVLPFLIVGAGYLAYVFDIGLLGAAAEKLPFRMAGIIFYSRIVLIPALLLFAVASASRAGDLFKARIGIALFLFHGLIDMFLRASRGALLMVVLLIIFLIAVGGYPLRRSDRRIIALASVLALITVPLVSTYRFLRLAGLGILDVLPRLFQSQGSMGSALWAALAGGFTFVFFRIPGVEVLVSMLGLEAQPLGGRAVSVLLSPRGVGGYLTVEIFGYPPDLPHSNSPSFLGWFYLVGGVAAVVMAAIGLAWVVTIGWNALGRNRLYCGPALECLALWLLFNVLTEGTLEAVCTQALTVVGSLMLIEIALRFLRLFRVTVRLNSGPQPTRA